MKKSLSLLVAIAMVFSMFATSVFAADEPTTEAKFEELVKAGIFAGMPGGDPALDQTMTRAQAAVIIAKLAGYKDGVTSPDAGFTDVPATHWAKAYVDFAANLGIISGLGNGTFAPSANVTIQELAKLAVDALAKLGYKLKDAAAVEGTVADWAKDYVGKAIANGIFAAQPDYTVPALRGLLVTATYSAYQALQVPSAIVVESVKATNSKTIVATFNVEVGTAIANDFTVHAKDDVYALTVIDSVAISGKEVKLTLAEALSNGKEYTVVASGVVSKENNLTLAEVSNNITYTATAPATIGFVNTSVAGGKSLEVVIKDANGVDVTADFDLSNDSVVIVESSDENRIGLDLKATYNGNNNEAQHAIVNVRLVVDEDGKEIETGNTIISVYETLAVAGSIGKVTLAVNEDLSPNFDKEDLAVYELEGAILHAQVLDAAGSVIPDLIPTFRSQNTKVAVVDQDTGAIYGIKAGTATIVVQSTFNGKTVSKTVTITVREQAKLTSLALEVPNSKLVIDSGINQELKVKFLDQYGEDFALTANSDVSFKINKGNENNNGNFVVDGMTKNEVQNVPTLAGATSQVFELVPGNAKGTATLTVSVGSISKTLSVSLVEKGTFAGYVAIASATTLDLDFDGPKAASGATNTVTFNVYKKDVNGNYIEPVTDFEVVDGDTDAVNVDANNVVTGANKGAETVTVKVGGAKIATAKLTVINSEPALTKVSQVKNAITVEVGDDVLEAIFGTTKDGGALVGYDQYNEKFAFAGVEVVAASSKDSVVDQTTFNAEDEGTATVTVIVNNQVFVITVKVV